MDGGMRMHRERRKKSWHSKIGTSRAPAPTHRSPCRTRRAAFSSHPLEKPRDVQGSMTQGRRTGKERSLPSPGKAAKGRGRPPHLRPLLSFLTNWSRVTQEALEGNNTDG